jgi:cation diffusion facilitator family transporter
MPVNTAANRALIINIFLFVLKITIGIISNSIAMISEAVNSFTDIISSIAIKFSIKISFLKPDKKHQFGHTAAQPIATFIISVLAWVLGIDIIQESIKRIVNPPEINISIWVYLVLGITIITKVLMSKYQNHVGKKYNSPAVRAQAVDSMNDVLASSLALLGILGVQIGYPRIDGVGGLMVAIFILRAGYEIARENIGYLMHKAADENLIVEIANRALKVKGVKGLNDLRSHYVGDKIHVEIHIEVNKSATTLESHDIGKQVQFALEELPEVQKAFIHIDPV